MTRCHTCELTERRDRGEAPTWDSIIRTDGWDLAHAYDTAVEGWLVLVARRHITTVADLTPDEATDLGSLVRSVSTALTTTLGCAKTYLVQFAEHPLHPHVHVHVIPRASDLAPEHRGPGIFALLGVEADRCVPETRMDEIARAVRKLLA
jgi:diadenosine tetraphosphate (Ap4A) HIT family hydrolase